MHTYTPQTLTHTHTDTHAHTHTHTLTHSLTANPDLLNADGSASMPVPMLALIRCMSTSKSLQTRGKSTVSITGHNVLSDTRSSRPLNKSAQA